MKSILSYVRGIMEDNGGSPSSKRLVTLLSALLIFTGYVANLFWDFTVEEFMFNSMMYITIAGLGFTGMEKFTPKPPVK